MAKQREYIDFKLYLTGVPEGQGACQVALLPTPEVGETVTPVTVATDLPLDFGGAGSRVLAHLIGVFFPQPGRALDVGEEEDRHVLRPPFPRTTVDAILAASGDAPRTLSRRVPVWGRARIRCCAGYKRQHCSTG